MFQICKTENEKTLRSCFIKIILKKSFVFSHALVRVMLNMSFYAYSDHFFSSTYFVSCNGPCALKEKRHRKEHIVVIIILGIIGHD